MRDRDRWGRICFGLALWFAAVVAGFVCVMLFPSPARGQIEQVEKLCKAFADNTLMLAPLREQVKDEDLAHSMVPMAGPSELWPTLHWQIRLVYRTPPEKLRAEALLDCLRHHGKQAAHDFTVVLGIRG